MTHAVEHKVTNITFLSVINIIYYFDDDTNAECLCCHATSGGFG